MFRKKTPTEHNTALQIDINATPAQVFAVIDPASPDNEMRQQGYIVDAIPDVPDTFMVQSEPSNAEYDHLTVEERQSPVRLTINSHRLSEEPLFGYLLGSSSIYELSALDTGGTRLELRETARFHPKAKPKDLEFEHRIFEIAISSHIEKVRCCSEFPPEKNEYHPIFRINRFWAWFAENETPLRAANFDNVDLLSELSEQLQRMSSSLSFELRQLDGGLTELAIHADGMSAGFPAVKQAVSLAPHDALSEWKVVAFKQPKGELDGQLIVGSDAFDPKSVRYKLEPVNEFGTRDITLYFESYSRRTREQHMGRAFAILDHCLGEYNTATAVGEIEMAAISSAVAESMPINSLVYEFE